MILVMHPYKYDVVLILTFHTNPSEKALNFCMVSYSSLFLPFQNQVLLVFNT